MIPLSAPLPHRATVEDGFFVGFCPGRWGPSPNSLSIANPPGLLGPQTPGLLEKRCQALPQPKAGRQVWPRPLGRLPPRGHWTGQPGFQETPAPQTGGPGARVSWARRVAGSPVLETRAQTPPNSTAPPRPGPARQRPPQGRPLGRLGWAEAERKKGRGRWGGQSQAVRGAGCHVPSRPQRLVATAQKRRGVGKP